MIIGIDPSYTGTGICVTSDDGGVIYYTERFSSSWPVYTDHGYTRDSREIADHVKDLVCRLHGEHPDEEINFIIEYPAFNNRAGSFLAVLHGALDYVVHSGFIPVNSVYYVPPVACNCFTKNKDKTKVYLQRYCVEQGWTPVKLDHDCSTALILVHIYLAIKAGTYPNKFDLGL